MSKDITVDAAKFDAVLKRMLDSKPLSKAEISARIKAEKDRRSPIRKPDANQSHKGSRTNRKAVRDSVQKNGQVG
jgi:hypothetical protein